MALRIKGHKLTVEWSGEYGEERSSTGVCPCGWTESGSTQAVVRFEYRQHLKDVRRRELRAPKAEGVEAVTDYGKIGSYFYTCSNTLPLGKGEQE